ncbi:hypothetical protein [Maricaulis sp.]|uniref:hypothetical protein n=1 Tax=Maricaulis sp. TaxID=1486257 RepID=UPI002B271612|nr:hypothetical protein [Maricaulis sp.]
MTDIVDAGDTTKPGADAWQRAGLTRREAIRRERVERWRGETQSPWEAGAVGLTLWLLWRAVFKGLQPLWLIGSLVVAAWFAVQGLAQTGGLAGHVAAQPGERERLSALVHAAVPPGEDARDIWLSRLEEALRGDRRRRADMDRFRSWAALGPDLIGRDRLALDLLAGAAGPRALDAELRAGPAWQRRARLDAAFDGEMARGAALGLSPPALIFAPDTVRQSQAGRQFAWAIANTSADGFFRGAYRGQFEMRSVPGLVAFGAGDTRLYGGVRHLVIQICADPRTRLDGCDSAIIPPAPVDDLALALAAVESGLVNLPGRDRAMASGAEILIAARRAGRLHPQLEAWLAAELAGLLPGGQIGEAFAGAMIRPDIAFAAPSRAEPMIEARIDASASAGAVGVATVLQSVARLRRQTSSFEVIRLMSEAGSPDRLADLQRVAELAGPATLAVMEWLGEDAVSALQPLPPRQQAEPHIQQALVLALASAALVLLLTLIRLMTPDRLRRASRASLTDAWISRLLLGRKI